MGVLGVGHWRAADKQLALFSGGTDPVCFLPPAFSIPYVSPSKKVGKNPTGEPEPYLEQGGCPWTISSIWRGDVELPLRDPSLPLTKTLCPHTYGHRLLSTPPTASPVSHNEHHGWIWSSSVIFELRINISRMRGMLHISVSDAVASLPHFERAIEKEKGVTTSILLPSSTVGTLLLWTQPSWCDFPWISLVLVLSLIPLRGESQKRAVSSPEKLSMCLLWNAHHLPDLWTGGHWPPNGTCSPQRFPKDTAALPALILATRAEATLCWVSQLALCPGFYVSSFSLASLNSHQTWHDTCPYFFMSWPVTTFTLSQAQQQFLGFLGWSSNQAACAVEH